MTPDRERCHIQDCEAEAVEINWHALLGIGVQICAVHRDMKEDEQSMLFVDLKRARRDHQLMMDSMVGVVKQ